MPQRARPGGIRGRVHDAPDAIRHLQGRAAREREEQDTAGIGAIDDEVGDTAGKRRGLARAGARDDQQRARRIGRFIANAECRGPALVGVKGVEEFHER